MNIEQLKKTVKYCDVTPDRNLLYPDTLPLGRVGKDRSLIVLVLDGEDTVQTAAQRRLVNDLKTNTHTQIMRVLDFDNKNTSVCYIVHVACTWSSRKKKGFFFLCTLFTECFKIGIL